MSRNISNVLPGTTERSPPADESTQAAEKRASQEGDQAGAEFEANRAARPIIGIIIASVVLYLGRGVLLPIAMAFTAFTVI